MNIDKRNENEETKWKTTKKIERLHQRVAVRNRSKLEISL